MMSRRACLHQIGETEKLQKKWVRWGSTRLRSQIALPAVPRASAALSGSIIDSRQPNETITIVVPQFIPAKRWHNALHMRTADLLRNELLSKSGVVVTDVPYRLVEDGRIRRPHNGVDLD
jgi:hypothetical protein